MCPDSQKDASPTEVIVAQIWAEELCVTAVGPDSDFFELGGDSLLMFNMLFRVAERLKIETPHSMLLEASTLRSFCLGLDLMARTNISEQDPSERSIPVRSETP
jgi:acyl carrier protein